MPRDFKQFAQENRNSSNDAEQLLKNNSEKVNDYQHIIDKYKNMNQSELMTNLFSEARKLKQEGKLDSNSLNNLSSTLSPFLSGEQQEMLSSIIRMIDEQK